jgi:hypothetical protein
MSAFWTFALCLTTAYAIYYTVTILLDLNNRKEKSNDSVETFELKNVPEAPGKVVEETEGGFRVAKEDGTGGQPAWDETKIRPAVVTQPASPEAPAPLFDASGAPITEGRKKIEAVEKEMVDVETQMSGEMTEKMLNDVISGQTPSVVIDREVIPSKGGQSSESENHDKGKAI